MNATASSNIKLIITLYYNVYSIITNLYINLNISIDIVHHNVIAISITKLATIVIYK